MNTTPRPAVVPQPRRWIGMQPMPLPRPSLAPLAPEQVSAVFDDAERAAAHHWITGDAGVNPHAKGSRAFVLWITHYYAMLLDMTLEEEPAQPLAWDMTDDDESGDDAWLPAGAAFMRWSGPPQVPYSSTR